MEIDEEMRSRRLAVAGDTVVMYVEMAIYAIVSLALIVGALALAFEAFRSFVDEAGDGIVLAATRMLSVLLLVFVFVELLGAVRSTISERRLVAEPFLLVGIIASIKEIVLIGGTDRSVPRDPDVFRDAMIEIAVLSGVVLLLAVATLLLRRSAPPSEPVAEPLGTDDAVTPDDA